MDVLWAGGGMQGVGGWVFCLGNGGYDLQEEFAQEKVWVSELWR